MKVDDKFKYKGTILRVLYLGLTCDDGPLAIVFVEKADKKHKWKLGSIESVCQSLLKENFTKMTSSSDFWEGVRESAKQVQSGPSWMKAGVTLSANFDTFTFEKIP